VAVDVIRATTTAVTAAAMGRRIYPAGSIEAAVRLAADLDRPILSGELGGVQPYGFDLQNSPSQVAELEPSHRPIILLSTSGTRLIAEAARHGPTYLCCLRNARAQAAYLASRGSHVVILGAATRGEFREEDQLCAARVARDLVRHGYRVAGRSTAQVLERFGDAPDDVFVEGRSAKYLRDTGQDHDLAFVLEHVDDLEEVFVIHEGAVRPVTMDAPSARAGSEAAEPPGQLIGDQAEPQHEKRPEVVTGEPGSLPDAAE
jgi:2-phosphosulfolactate phosphatase